ncbi:hypothetical protein QE250_03830 [Chromatiaceae bacterium AAb-1]|nr:hypothetical protein [Chromatiaceae bacterium AAb-1]
MSDALRLLQQVAEQLHTEGKTPSLALFKARLAGQLPAPVLFSAYQQWRSHAGANHAATNKEQIAEQAGSSKTASDSKTESTPAINNELQQTLARIEAKLDILLSRGKL